MRFNAFLRFRPHSSHHRVAVNVSGAPANQQQSHAPRASTARSKMLQPHTQVLYGFSLPQLSLLQYVRARLIAHSQQRGALKVKSPIKHDTNKNSLRRVSPEWGSYARIAPLYMRCLLRCEWKTSEVVHKDITRVAMTRHAAWLSN